MDEYKAKGLVLDWGEKIVNAQKSASRSCPYSGTEECKRSTWTAFGGIYSRMSRTVVGFTKGAPYSSATQETLAVICQCDGCKELYWYHIKREAIEAFVSGCQKWPQEQKEKFKI